MLLMKKREDQQMKKSLALPTRVTCTQADCMTQITSNMGNTPLIVCQSSR